MAARVEARNAEEKEKMREAAANLVTAKALLEKASEAEKAVAQRRLTRATICDILMRERNGETKGVECHCGHVKSRGNMCGTCQEYRHALYGGENWVLYGVCRSSQC
jgi:hypothetical protein